MTTKKTHKNFIQSRLTVTLLLLAAILALLVGFGLLQQVVTDSDINSFKDCAASGRPILETYPEQCIGPDGTHYTKQYDNMPPKSDI